MIKQFDGTYRFLSNFWPCWVVFNWHHSTYVTTTVEHAFQASKATNIDDFLKVLHNKTPGAAKRLAKTIRLRTDWELVKMDIMKKLVADKFLTPTLKRSLIETGDQDLVEGNYWHDNFWGDCYCNNCSKIEGLNYLGKILMEVRNELVC